MCSITQGAAQLCYDAHMAQRRARVPCLPVDAESTAGDKRKSVCQYLDGVFDDLRDEMVTFLEEPSERQLKCVHKKCRQVKKALQKKGHEYIELARAEVVETKAKQEHRVMEIEGGLFSCTRATVVNGVLICRCARGKGFSGFRPAKRRKDAERHCKRANLPLSRSDGDEYRELKKIDKDIADWIE